MNADGSGVATLLESDDWLNLHDWSADGELLLFTKNVRSSTPGRQDIYLLRLRDGTVIRLTAAAGMHWTPAFWPENPSVPVMR
jgi:Tol biopolymer transport system component